MKGLTWSQMNSRLRTENFLLRDELKFRKTILHWWQIGFIIVVFSFMLCYTSDGHAYTTCRPVSDREIYCMDSQTGEITNVFKFDDETLIVPPNRSNEQIYTPTRECEMIFGCNPNKRRN